MEEENYSWSDGTNTYVSKYCCVSYYYNYIFCNRHNTLGCMNTAQITINVNSYIIKVEDVSICSERKLYMVW